MSLITQFAKYAAAFEEAYKSDDWTLVEPYFAEDAVYEVAGMPAPLGGRFAGREAILACFKSVLDGFDRKFDSRAIALVAGPREQGRSVWIRGSAVYRSSRAPKLAFELEETTTFDDQGRIERLEDHYDADTIRAVTAYASAHGKALGLASTTP